MNAQRKEAILRLVQTRVVHSVEELHELLQHGGIQTTPAAIARDVKQLGLIQAPFRDESGATFAKYVVPGAVAWYPSQLHRVVAEIVASVAAAENIIVLKTPPASAAMVAAELDRAAWPEIAGTIAGDDTVFAVCVSTARVPKTLERLREMRARTSHGQEHGS